jgi:branched-chain amino acid transport system substrate-binding protein
VRGKFVYNTNHFPIQNFYLLKAVAGATPGGDPVLEIQKPVFTNHKDAYYQECPMKW